MKEIILEWKRGLEVDMEKETIYKKALEEAKSKKNENDSLVLAIQGGILGFALFWEIRKLLKGDSKKK